jgi:alcohol dehydrogenase class IV
MAVSLTAPAVFRMTFSASPERHLRAARLLGGDGQGPDALPRILRQIMDDVGIPSGLAAVGYTEDDVPDLVAGSLAQQRLQALAPVSLTPDDLAATFRESL